MKRLLIGTVLLASTAMASPAPVVTATPGNGTTLAMPTKTLNSGSTSLETTGSLKDQVAALQKSVATLSSQLDVQTHNIQLLNSQQRSFYQDLNQKIQQLKNLNGNSNPPNVLAQQPKTDQDLSTYQDAFSLVKAKNSKAAINALKGYLKSYPAGKYVPNAYYWLGKLESDAGHDKAANKDFQASLKAGPQSKYAGQDKTALSQ